MPDVGAQRSRCGQHARSLHTISCFRAPNFTVSCRIPRPKQGAPRKGAWCEPKASSPILLVAIVKGHSNARIPCSPEKFGVRKSLAVAERRQCAMVPKTLQASRISFRSQRVQVLKYGGRGPKFHTCNGLRSPIITLSHLGTWTL